MSRGLVSLQAKHRGSGGSTATPAGSASARKATPMRTGQLSFHQSCPDSQTQLAASGRATVVTPKVASDVLAGTLADVDGPPSPDLSLLSPRSAGAGPNSPSHVTIALRSPSLSLPSPKPSKAVAISPGCLASPTLSLPRPKSSGAAAISPDQNGPTPVVEAWPQKGASLHLGSGGDDVFFSPEAVRPDRSADDVPSEEEQELQQAEVYMLSDIWKVFEQIVRQVGSHQSAVLHAFSMQLD